VKHVSRRSGHAATDLDDRCGHRGGARWKRSDAEGGTTGRQRHTNHSARSFCQRAYLKPSPSLGREGKKGRKPEGGNDLEGWGTTRGRPAKGGGHELGKKIRVSQEPWLLSTHVAEKEGGTAYRLKTAAKGA